MIKAATRKQVTPSPELSQLCKLWIPFLQKKHMRYGEWNKHQMSIGSSDECMVAEAWGWDSKYTAECIACTVFAHKLDFISQNNMGNNIRPTQVKSMIRNGNAFAKHYIKTHRKQ